MNNIGTRIGTSGLRQQQQYGLQEKNPPFSTTEHWGPLMPQFSSRTTTLATYESSTATRPPPQAQQPALPPGMRTPQQQAGPPPQQQTPTSAAAVKRNSRSVHRHDNGRSNPKTSDFTSAGEMDQVRFAKRPAVPRVKQATE